MNKLIMVGLLDGKAKESCRRVYDENGIAPTLNTCGGGQREAKVLIRLDFSNDNQFNQETYKTENTQ